MTLSGKETKLDQIFNDNIRDIPLSGHVMTLTEFICTEGTENGLEFHDIMIINGILY